MPIERNELKISQTSGASHGLWREITAIANRGIGFLARLRRKKRNSGYLFIAINGAGLGHLTRCLAIARKLRELAPDEIIVFATTSIGLPLVHQAGFVCHHIPPFAFIGKDISSREWNDLFYKNLDAILTLHAPSTLIFDGSTPYAGLQRVMKKFGKVNRVWIKRGLYKSSVDAEKLVRYTEQFHLTIIPGELDDRIEAKDARSTVSVDPIVMLDKHELLDRAAARRLLRLDADAPAAFVQLGAGNINAIAELQEKIVGTLKRAGVQTVLAQSPIALRQTSLSLSDNTISEFPSSRYYEAFDFAVLAGGYNSVNEAIFFGLPSIFLPNMVTTADDQLRRCNAAKAYGNAVVLESFDEDKLLQLALEFVEKGRRVAAAEPAFRNGALRAAELIVELDGSTRRSVSPR